MLSEDLGVVMGEAEKNLKAKLSQREIEDIHARKVGGTTP